MLSAAVVCCCSRWPKRAKKQLISHVTASGLLALYILQLSCFVRYNLSNQSEPLEFVQHFLESLWKFSRQKNAVQPIPVKFSKLTHNLAAIISVWKPYIYLFLVTAFRPHYYVPLVVV